MALIRLVNTDPNMGYYLNTNKTMLYCHMKNTDLLGRFYSDKWSSQTFNIIEVNEKTGVEEEKTLDIKSIVNADNDFIDVVQTISSTIKPKAFFEEDNIFGFREKFFNEFLGSDVFLNARINNKFKKSDNIVDLLKKKTPAFFTIIRNLFYQEHDDVIRNFMAWLNVAAFEDRHQDVIWCFFGTTESMQGQGAGKGVLMDFLTKLYSGLTITVTNSTYDNDFNGEMLNKKIVVFDEVSMKNLDWGRVKDATGRATLRVEFKGRDAITASNVASWLLFTNEWELTREISIRDRRAFLIQPNPTNESLIQIIRKKFLSFKKFSEQLQKETEDIVHIIERSGNKVQTPLQLKTKAYENYWSNKLLVGIEDLKNYEKIVVEKKMTLKFIEISKSNGIQIDSKIVAILKSGCINYRVFFVVFGILKDFGVVDKCLKPMFAWERVKQISIQNKFTIEKIDMKKTKSYERFSDKTFLTKPGLSSKKKSEIKKDIRELFGEKVNNVIKMDKQQVAYDYDEIGVVNYPCH